MQKKYKRKEPVTEGGTGIEEGTGIIGLEQRQEGHERGTDSDRGELAGRDLLRLLEEFDDFFLRFGVLTLHLRKLLLTPLFLSFGGGICVPIVVCLLQVPPVLIRCARRLGRLGARLLLHCGTSLLLPTLVLHRADASPEQIRTRGAQPMSQQG